MPKTHMQRMVWNLFYVCLYLLCPYVYVRAKFSFSFKIRHSVNKKAYSYILASLSSEKRFFKKKYSPRVIYLGILNLKICQYFLVRVNKEIENLQKNMHSKFSISGTILACLFHKPSKLQCFQLFKTARYWKDVSVKVIN